MTHRCPSCHCIVGRSSHRNLIGNPKLKLKNSKFSFKLLSNSKVQVPSKTLRNQDMDLVILHRISFCFDSLEMYQCNSVFRYKIHCKGRCKQIWNMFSFVWPPCVKHIVFVWNWLTLKMGKQDKVNNVSRVEGCGDIQLVKDVEIVRMFLDGNAVLIEATTSSVNMMIWGEQNRLWRNSLCSKFGDL